MICVGYFSQLFSLFIHAAYCTNHIKLGIMNLLIKIILTDIEKLYHKNQAR